MRWFIKVSPITVWKNISVCADYILKWEGKLCDDHHPLKFEKKSKNISKRGTNFIISFMENKVEYSKAKLVSILTIYNKNAT